MNKIFNIFIYVLVGALPITCYAEESNQNRYDYIVEHFDKFLYDRTKFDLSQYDDLVVAAQLLGGDAAFKFVEDPVAAVKDSEKAIEYYNKAISMEPAEPISYRGKALLQFYYLNQKDKALENAKLAMNKGWDYFDLPLIIGELENSDQWLMKAYQLMQEESKKNSQIKDLSRFKELEQKFGN